MEKKDSYLIRHPWLLILYLLGVTFTTFLLPTAVKPAGVVLLFTMQFVVLAVFRQLDWSVLRIFRRLRFLFVFLIGVNALLPGAGGENFWIVPGVGLKINISGALGGILMSSQIALVVLTTHVVRTIGDETSFINGLRSLRVAPLLAYSLDTTMAMLAGSLRGGGGGGGGMGTGGGHGGGRHRQGFWRRWFRRSGGGRGDGSGGGRGDGSGRGASEASAAGSGGVLALFRALKDRDLTPFIERINTGLADAARHAHRLGLSEKRAHDVGVIGGIAAAMMAFKLVKILPGMPVMQGAKTIFFIPLYILAADRSHTRWGGTIAGGIMGFIAFLNGDSRYGIFEVLKHLVPGLVIDLVWPFVRRVLPLAARLRLRVAGWTLLDGQIMVFVLVGWLAAAARTSTQFAMILALASDNATLLVFPALKLIPNAIAGTLSALVSYPMIKHLGADAIAEREARTAASETADTQHPAPSGGSASGGEPTSEITQPTVDQSMDSNQSFSKST